MSVCIVGRGKVGRSMLRALRAADVACMLLPGTRLGAAPPAARVYLLAVPDAALAPVSAQLAEHLSRSTRVLHLAGARGLDELAALKQRGLSVGVMHPLVSFADTRAEHALPGATFTCFGDRAAIGAARQLTRRLHARCVVIDPPDATYHAAAALVANGSAALAQMGAQILMPLGFTRSEAEHALAGLLTSVARNVAQVGVPAALTGPVVRGDDQTVARHLAALARRDRKSAAAYAALQPIVVACARAAGLDAKGARRILHAVANR